MARKILGFVLILAAVAAIPAGAQLIGRTATVTTLPACNGTKQMALVTDATNATTLGAGGGSASVWVSCATGSWAIEEVAAVSDLSGYVQDSEDAAVSITATGAGHDVSLIAADDVFLTPTDALTAVAGGNTTITSTAGTVAIASSAGAVTVTATGATNDVTLTATDDVILAATDDTTVAGDQFAVNTTTAVIDAGAGADEITVAAGSTTILGTLVLPIASAPPAACAAGTKGAIYYDSDINKLCLCNGTNYVLVNDDSTTTGCS